MSEFRLRLFSKIFLYLGFVIMVCLILVKRSGNVQLVSSLDNKGLSVSKLTETFCNVYFAVIHNNLVFSVINFVIKDVLLLLHVVNLWIMVSLQCLVIFVSIIQERALWDRESLVIVRFLDTFIILINFIPVVVQIDQFFLSLLDSTIDRRIFT